ncbi:GntR family transcriptional regulator [Pseudomonas sp. JM0905a]|uniref:GntR family transcriptional regulator n=1 Tax=Pseudomonas sp. JM0905a TaxID=2772484 RepID=UPI0016895DEF|nr:GntR family transcriptional regulator [Pseudomonas sp. JM0905a]MBD2837828.1 GntR family transcriptional regulator [Pseudomonas sp. JM0905a]
MSKQFIENQTLASKRQPADEQAVQVLRKAVLQAELEPGSRVTENGLADLFALSRGAIRSALHHLSQEGLFLKIPYCGWAVMPISSADAWELYTLRANLEMLAASLASQNMDSSSSAELLRAFEELANACRKQDRTQVAEADFKLHKTIVTLSRHKRLQQQYRIVQQQIRVYIASSDALTPDFQTFIDHHRPIVDAILARDADLAAKLSSEHNLSEGKKLHRHLLTLESARIQA